MRQEHEINQSFGRESVNPTERRDRIRTVFTAVAPRYDLMNDLMSMGIHRLWKRKLARSVRSVQGQVIDLAGGTGDVARLLRAPNRQVTVCDPSQAMMQVGQQRPDMVGIDWLVGEAEQLPLADASVDLLTVSFGLRNATHLERALAEIHRVLKPGGQFVCLEFSQPAFWLAPFYNLYSFLVIPRLGALVARAPIAYQYLVESIRRFPNQQGFADLMRQAGFTGIRWSNLSFGIACLHYGTRAP
ncbi:class I SAM-dependent methyltransferase [Rhodoferax sp. U2-2l]|uniref:class I SAM-dependent methyltransferase n=1 Tax=Rhodoferax sp. U2-2l TaxID=2884000 RepID=UPI001D0AC307|nr:class I SAM-dependent methyltransferase [Rhodoferax sp. U2-2l]MCB8749041.1 class I SAM-dependent methyltransferase [Rhodoferax sp. U2-2l]